jgi:hypothetical protein
MTGSIIQLMGVTRLDLYKLALTSALLLTLLTPTLTVTAQIEAVNSLSIVLTPDTPRSYSTVGAKVESFTHDLQSATIAWTLDGKSVSKGLGLTSVEIQTGDLGKRMSLRATVTLKSGESFASTATLIPGEVDLIAEAHSYTHPFYTSKSLLPASGKVTLTAMPHLKNSSGVLLDRSTLIYTWKDGVKVLGSLSGAGRQSITIDGPQLLRDKIIQVEVANQDRTLKARNLITLKPYAQKVVLYEHNPTLGVLFQRAYIGAQSFRGRELTLAAFPYFFSASARHDQDLMHAWSLNGSTIDNPSDVPGTLTVGVESEGKANIDYSVRGTDHILEKAGTRLDLSFSSEANQSQP